MPNNTDKLILVVEDEKLVRELLETELGKRGYRTVSAKDGMEALEVWRDKAPDLVLLDLLLPKMDGFQLMKTIREKPDDKVNRARVIVLSNLWEKSDIERMNQYKIEDYLVKAYNTVDDVIARIEKVFQK